MVRTFRVTEQQTVALARALASQAKAGDTLLLHGPVGAGKSVFSRAFIRAVLNDATAEIPSPSFTLVQTYFGPACEIWHADLYRLSSPDEVSELGLDDVFADVISLVEWPDKLADLTPDRHLVLNLQPVIENADLRDASVDYAGPGWDTARHAVDVLAQRLDHIE